MQVTLLPDAYTGTTGSRSTTLSKGPTLEGEKERLRKAAKDIESLFLYQMLQSMRKTIPESSLSKGGGLSGDLGKDVYTQMFDQELASKMAGTNDRSLADLLYESMEKLVVAQFNSEPSQTESLNEILPQNNYIKIKKEKAIEPRELNPRDSRGNEVELDRDKISKAINKISKKYNLSPELVHAVVRAESNFDPNAVSKAGAKGLMQLVDTTASDMGVRNVFDPEENLEGGAKYLRKLLDDFGDLKLALAAYNAGPGTVQRYGGVPPYRETENYVKNILARISETKPGAE